MEHNTGETVRSIKQNAIHIDSLSVDSSWLDNCLPGIGDSDFVLLGEASHGTHDFYRMRAEITKRLIAEKGFSAVAVEADWPDTYRVSRYVKGNSEDADSELALSGFKRFPTWMWRNADVLDFVGWLRSHNDALKQETPKVGFYGMDLYSLYTSMEAVIGYLEEMDPQAVLWARQRYACFDHFNKNSQTYGYLAGSGISHNCEEEVIRQLVALQKDRAKYLKYDGPHREEDFFNAEQNARVVKNAEAYYRTMFRGHISSWNLRDQHMVETLEMLRAHLRRSVKHPRIIVWAHNSHLGDARFTQMGETGEWNVGQLIKQRYHDQAFLLGFTTYKGTVTAASNWDSVAERKLVRPAMTESYEEIFHRTNISRFILNFRQDDFLRHRLKNPRLERAIGVIYRPDTERASHYFHASLSQQFDAVFHLDETRAVEPLEKSAVWVSGEAPETYPSAI